MLIVFVFFFKTFNSELVMGCVQTKKLNRATALTNHHRRNNNNNRNSFNSAVFPAACANLELPATQQIRGPVKTYETEPVTPVTFPNFRRQNGRLNLQYDTNFCDDTHCETLKTDMSLSEALERTRRARALFFQPVEKSFHQFEFTTPNSNNETIENESVDHFSDDFQDENNNELKQSKEQLCCCKATRQESMRGSFVHSDQPNDELAAQNDQEHISENVLSEPYTPQSQHSNEMVMAVSSASVKSLVQISSAALLDSESFDEYKLNAKVRPCVYKSIYSVLSEPIVMQYKHSSNASLRLEIEQMNINDKNEEKNFVTKRNKKSRTSLNELKRPEAGNHIHRVNKLESCFYFNFIYENIYL